MFGRPVTDFEAFQSGRVIQIRRSQNLSQVVECGRPVADFEDFESGTVIEIKRPHNLSHVATTGPRETTGSREVVPAAVLARCGLHVV